jgi:hypothetical protein
MENSLNQIQCLFASILPFCTTSLYYYWFAKILLVFFKIVPHTLHIKREVELG